jgi:hypothetical protein
MKQNPWLKNYNHFWNKQNMNPMFEKNTTTFETRIRIHV